MSFYSVPILTSCIALTLVGQCIIAPRFGKFASVILRLQATYWGIAYVLRPMFLYLAKPIASSPLADRRLAATDYGEGLASVLLLVLSGLMIFFLTLLMISFLTPLIASALKKRSALSNHPAYDMTGWTSALVIMLILGWCGRLSEFVGLDVLRTPLTPFGTVAVGLLIMTIGSPKTIGKSTQLWFLGLTISEASWSLISETKTPIIALFTTLALRAAISMTNRQRRITLPALGLMGVCAFLIIQPLKGVNTASQVSSYDRSGNPLVVGAATSLLERFDLLSAVTDARFFPMRPWLPPVDYAKEIALSALPKGPLLEHEGFGLRWTREVRSTSVPYQYQDVSLATGPIAEGEVQAGITGVIIQSSLLALFTLGVCGILGSPFFALRAGAGIFVFDSVLYERGGLLGVAEGFAKAIEVGLTAALLVLITRAVARSLALQAERSVRRRSAMCFTQRVSEDNGGQRIGAPSRSDDSHVQSSPFRVS